MHYEHITRYSAAAAAAAAAAALGVPQSGETDR